MSCDSPPLGLRCDSVNGKSVHVHTDGTWWFWDETWCRELGPYPDELTCDKAAAEYGRLL
jgi:hypothetical protein